MHDGVKVKSDRPSLATEEAFDRILVIDGGRIIEEGIYEELMFRDGAFVRLVHKQLL